MSDKRQKNQLVLAFTEEERSEAPKTSQEGTESLTAKCETERPASHEQLMEEVCERENCCDHFLHYYRTSYSTNSTKNWNGASIASCGMRTTAISTSAANGQDSG